MISLLPRHDSMLQFCLDQTKNTGEGEGEQGVRGLRGWKCCFWKHLYCVSLDGCTGHSWQDLFSLQQCSPSFPCWPFDICPLVDLNSVVLWEWKVTGLCSLLKGRKGPLVSTNPLTQLWIHSTWDPKKQDKYWRMFRLTCSKWGSFFEGYSSLLKCYVSKHVWLIGKYLDCQPIQQLCARKQTVVVVYWKAANLAENFSC